MKLSFSTGQKNCVAGTSKGMTTYVSADALARIYDDCAIRKFDQYHTIFFTIHWCFAVVIISLSTLSGLASTPALTNNSSAEADAWLNPVSTAAGLTAAILASIDKIVNFQRVADDCKYARSELVFYVAQKRKMPRHTYDRIGQTRLLCLRHPSQCSRSTELAEVATK